MARFTECFSDLPDPRAENAWHDLAEVLFVALAAILCGARNCSDMAEFGRAKEGLLRQMLRLAHGVPSHDTFSRIFRQLDPVAFEAAFRKFMAGFAAAVPRGVVAIDGKALRGAFEQGRRSAPLHLVNVWAVEARLAVAQCRAPGRNEVAGALEVLQLLSLDGCIVTADALHCHPAMADRIRQRGGEYVLALKENHAPLLAATTERLDTERLDTAGHRCQAEQVSTRGHDRSERRRATVVSAADLAAHHNFPGLAAVARVEMQRTVAGKPEPPVTRHFVLSRAFPPAQLLDIVRAHWTIENQLHWVLDVVFEEDRARNRKDNGPENLAILRKLALNLLRQDAAKGSLPAKIKRAAWNDTFLLNLLTQMR
jgi:predicted transposase YbfD/YdcC